MSTDTQWVRDEGWVTECSFQTDPGSRKYFEPPEVCGRNTEPGEEFCTLHRQEPSEPADERSYGSFDECYEFRAEGA